MAELGRRARPMARMRAITEDSGGEEDDRRICSAFWR